MAHTGLLKLYFLFSVTISGIGFTPDRWNTHHQKKRTTRAFTSCRNKAIYDSSGVERTHRGAARGILRVIKIFSWPPAANLFQVTFYQPVKRQSFLFFSEEEQLFISSTAEMKGILPRCNINLPVRIRCWQKGRMDYSTTAAAIKLKVWKQHQTLSTMRLYQTAVSMFGCNCFSEMKAQSQSNTVQMDFTPPGSLCLRVTSSKRQGRQAWHRLL